LTSKLPPQVQLSTKVSLAHSKKTPIELVKGKQRVHQIHAASDENLQVENLLHLIYKWGCLSQPHFGPVWG